MQRFLFLLTELSSQQRLRVLFPDSEGEVFPPIKKLPYKTNKHFINLRRIVDGKLTTFNSKSTLIARNHVIIGWKERDIIRPLSNVAGKTDHVFDTYINQFVTLGAYDLWKLGIDRRISYVHSSDKAAAENRKRLQANTHAKPLAVPQGNHKINHKIDHQSILQTIYEANNEANRQAKQQAILQTIYKANQQLNVQENRQSNNERNQREKVKEHHQVNHGENHHTMYPAHYQVSEQANLHLIHEKNHQAYDAAHDHNFGGNGHNQFNK